MKYLDLNIYAMYKFIINKTKNKLNNSFLKNIYRIKMTKNKIV